MQRGTETILLVDDEQPLLKLTRRLLERLGYTVIEAESPSAALNAIEAHTNSVHLLMTDVSMPEMTGQELYLQIRKHKPDIRCLFMSGYMADTTAHTHSISLDGCFIHKPFDMSLLAMRVREALRS